MAYQSIRKGSSWCPQAQQKTSQFAFGRPFASPRRSLAKESPPWKAAGTIQRKLNEVAEETEDAAYAQIKERAEQYNTALEEDPGHVVQLLHLLDQIDRDAKAWLFPFAELLETDSQAHVRKWQRLKLLLEEVKVEKESLLTKPEPADVLPGAGATLPLGAAWFLYRELDGEWIDASSITADESLKAKITGQQDDEWLFTVDNGKSKGKAKKDQVTLGSRFKDMSLALLYPSGTPKPEEVLQSNLGDCYLQAALASLAAQKPGYIKNEMIYDAGDKVVVRLFKLPEYTAKNIAVEKSTPETKEGQELYNRGALWVKMIQKAYAASGLGKSLLQTATISYEDIGGPGHLAAFAMGVLLGKEIDSHAASGGAQNLEDSDEEDADECKFPWSDPVQTYGLYRQYQRTPELVDPTDSDRQYNAARALLGQIFGNVVADMDDWAKLAEDHQSDLDEFESIEQFETLFTDEELAQRLAEPILGWVRDSGLYRGAVGSGQYSLGQQTLLQTIEEALAAHRIVVTGTKKEPPEGAEAFGGSGEPKYEGLAFGHAYTVLAVRRDASTNPDDEEAGPHAWLKIRNPWGYYGRSYETGGEAWEAQEVPEGNGTFWIELNDFSANFKEVEIG